MSCTDEKHWIHDLNHRLIAARVSVRFQLWLQFERRYHPLSSFHFYMAYLFTGIHNKHSMFPGMRCPPDTYEASLGVNLHLVISREASMCTHLVVFCWRVGAWLRFPPFLIWLWRSQVYLTSLRWSLGSWLSSCRSVSNNWSVGWEWWCRQWISCNRDPMVHVFLERIMNLMISQALGVLLVKHLAFQLVDDHVLLLEHHRGLQVVEIQMLLMDPWSLTIRLRIGKRIQNLSSNQSQKSDHGRGVVSTNLI